jgi:ABC-type transport system substrate-binding protein
MNKNPVTYDPGRIQEPEDIDLISNIYEGLVSYNEKNEIVPQLAESFEAQQSGKVWIFKLRDATFHNGRKVTAQDFKWTLERNLDKDFGSPVAYNYLSDILGAKEMNEGQADTLRGVDVIDEKTLQITLDAPRPYFLGKITYPCAFVLCKEAAGAEQIRQVSQMVGTGPFKVTDILPEQQINLAANADYYGGKPLVDKIERPIIKDPTTRLTKFRKGELDILNVQRSEVDAVRQDATLGKQLQFVPRPVVYYIGMNRSLYRPFQDVRLRRAFAMAIDRERIANDLLGGMPVAHGLIAHGVVGYRENYEGLPYNPTEAKRLMAQAGHPNGRGLPPLEIYYREAQPDSRMVAEAVFASLKQNIGFPIKLRALEASVFFEKRNAGKLPGFFLSWGADYLDPQNFTTFLLRSDSSMDFEKYKNIEFDRVGKEADETLDPDKRIKLYQQAEDILIQDVARVPLYYGRDSLLVSPKVTGLRMNLMGLLPHNKVQITR